MELSFVLDDGVVLAVVAVVLATVVLFGVEVVELLAWRRSRLKGLPEERPTRVRVNRKPVTR